MEYVNDLYKYVQSDGGPRRETLDEAIDALLLVLAPMAPHLTAELWERRHGAAPTSTSSRGRHSTRSWPRPRRSR